MSVLRGITIKLPEPTLRRLKRQAQQTGRSVAALVRERLELPVDREGASVHAIAADLAGALSGGRKPATNRRRRFRRS